MLRVHGLLEVLRAFKYFIQAPLQPLSRLLVSILAYVMLAFDELQARLR